MTIISIHLLVYLLVGAAAGVIGGLLGLGGGIVIVPALYFIFLWLDFPKEIIMQLAISTSLATIVFTAISASLAHQKKKAIVWSTVKHLTPGIVLGAIVGAMIADALPSQHLRILFGVFEILVAIQIWFNLKPKAQQTLPGSSGLVLAGFMIGTLSIVLGIGGGTLIVPFLLWCNADIRNAVATSSASGIPIALAGAVALAIVGLGNPALPEYSLGYIYLPAAIGITVTSMLLAPVGAKLAHKIPRDQLKKIFAITIFIIGLRILV